MPWISRPPIIGRAARLLVYTGIPINAAVRIASGFCPPRAAVTHAAGTVLPIRLSQEEF